MTEIEKIIHGERWPEFGQIARLQLVSSLEAEVERLNRLSLREISEQTKNAYTGQEERIERLTARIAELEQQLKNNNSKTGGSHYDTH